MYMYASACEHCTALTAKLYTNKYMYYTALPGLGILCKYMTGPSLRNQFTLTGIGAWYKARKKTRTGEDKTDTDSLWERPWDTCHVHEKLNTGHFDMYM